MRRRLNVTALFAGVGGLEFGLQKAGHKTSLLCESDAQAAAVLRARFPGVPILPDVRDVKTLAKRSSPGSNLLTAGFPCTDLSQAGRTLGFDGSQSVLIRHTLELAKRRRFDRILLENVPNWRVLHGGRYFCEVIKALEKLGYIWAYRTIDACAFGVPQRRRRIFLYASKVDDPRAILFQGNEPESFPKNALTESAHGFYWTEGNKGLGWGEDCIPTLKGGSTVSIPSPPAILLPNGQIVIPDIRDAERLQGFEAGWTDVDGLPVPGNGSRYNSRGRWKQVGNAVNVLVSTWIGDQLATPQLYDHSSEEVLKSGARWPNAAWGDGGQRYAVNITTWPVSARRQSLATFLQHPPTLLSVRATAGFHRRISASSLRFPEGFKEAVAAHLARVESARSSITDPSDALVAAE